MSLKKIDWINSALMLILISSFVTVYYYQDMILIVLTRLFELDEFIVFSGALSIIITIIHNLKTKKVSFNSRMSFNEFKIPFESIFSFLSNPVTIVCSISLAKGLFLQITKGTQYFPLFGNIELTFVGLFTVYLLYISIMEMINNMNEIFFIISSGENPKALPENQVKGKIPQPKSK